jgi:hypothetical protein
MSKVTPADVYRALLGAGFAPAAATTMTAIGMAESGLDASAEGDLALQTAVWGPSYGVFQVRTLKADTGTGTDRDITHLTSLASQAAAAWDISRRGTDFTPWTTWDTKAYQKYLDTASAAAGTAGTGAAATGSPAGLSLDPSTWVSVIGGALQPLMFESLTVLLGLGLIGFGLARVLGPTVKRAATTAGKAAKVAAVL